jgi:tripartite-type tricarboxylate transporter receptor subunit TctC
MFALPRRRLLASALLGMLGALSVLPSFAQNYPARPITLIVPWGAGGGTSGCSTTN